MPFKIEGSDKIYNRGNGITVYPPGNESTQKLQRGEAFGNFQGGEIPVLTKEQAAWLVYATQQEAAKSGYNSRNETGIEPKQPPGNFSVDSRSESEKAGRVGLQSAPSGNLNASQTSTSTTNLPQGLLKVNTPSGTVFLVNEDGNLRSATGDEAVAASLGQTQFQTISSKTDTPLDEFRSAGGGATGGQVDLSGLPPELQEVYGQLESFLTDLEERGQAINPDVEITPERLQEFAAQAGREIDPYYSDLLKSNVSNFLYDVGFSVSQILENERKLEQKLGRDIRSLSERAADVGFAQSGIRQREESNLAQDFGDTIGQNRRQLEFDANLGARQLATEFGGANVPTFNLPTAPTVSAGEGTFGRTLGSSPLYNLSDTVFEGLKGTRTFEQEAAKRSRVSELEAAERSRQALGQQRQLLL